MKQYFLYLRKSRADREAEIRGEGETLARHEKTLLELARNMNLNIRAVYKEIVSGESIASRPVIQKALSEVEHGLWDGCLVMEVERLARGDTMDQGLVAQTFKYSNTKIITPMKIYDPNNEFDEEYFEFGLFMSRREYKTINRRLQNGRKASVCEGKYLGSTPPYGYRRVKLENDKGFTLAPIPEQAAIVQLIFNLYVHGTDGEKTGVAQIAKKLNEMNIPPQTRADWVNSSIQGILSNPVYIGKIRWEHRKQIKKMEQGEIIKTRPRADDCIIKDGLHPPIIEESLYYSAQEIRKKNPPKPIGEHLTIKNPLAGLIICSECGRKMMRRPYRQTSQEDTLICPYTGCKTVSSKLFLVEEQLLSGLEPIVKNYELNNTLTLEKNINLFEIKKSTLIKKEKELSHLLLQKENLYTFLEQGIYSTEIFQERRKLLNGKISDLEHLIQSLQQDIVIEQAKQNTAVNLIPQCGNLLSAYWNLNIPAKNEVLKTLVEKVVYKKLTKNEYGKGGNPAFELHIYPKIPPS